MANKLKVITFDTLKTLNKQEIVLPSDYSHTFEQNAKNLGFDLQNYDIILEDLNQDTQKIDTIIEKTNKNLNSFKESATRASKAIQNSDNEELKSIQTDIDTMKKEIEFLQNELFTDTLTKVYNRKWFKDIYLQNDIFQEDGYLAFIDLNDFKQINDNHGHLVGDQVLKYLCNYLNKYLKEYAHSIIRYGGDEFVIIFSQKNNGEKISNQLISIQKKLLMQKLQSKNAHKSTFSFTFSFGFIAFNKYDSFDPIIQKADEKMYQNKLELKTKFN
ncbi:MAG: GGDEF domain-containing protein [Campylobacterota bacterium]|nr:GGDEF domain-containing protein [Campylobacterota bacterium]